MMRNPLSMTDFHGMALSCFLLIDFNEGAILSREREREREQSVHSDEATAFLISINKCERRSCIDALVRVQQTYFLLTAEKFVMNSRDICYKQQRYFYKQQAYLLLLLRPIQLLLYLIAGIRMRKS